mmetsp:Transcript_40037/g.124773  ORF Transcript_40037/g.124773 Transcript_40037/m.124773 type:complete len:305 (-) Transcript_40037:631-1545(-)
MTNRRSETGTNDQSAGGVPGSMPRGGACSARESQPKVFAVWWSAVKSPRTRSQSLPRAHLATSFQRTAPSFRASTSVGAAALSRPLGRMAVIAERHLRAHRQALQPVLTFISMACLRSKARPLSWLRSCWKLCPGSSLVVQRPSQARSRWRFAANSMSRARSRCALSLASSSSDPRRRLRPSLRLRLRLRWRRLLLLRLLRLRFRGGGSGSLALSQTLLRMCSRNSRQSPSSGKVCMIAGQLPRTQSLKRFASTTAARFSRQRNCARCRLGAQSYAVRIGKLAYRSSSRDLSNHSESKVWTWQL